jgi:glycosyltransferase involved in cell wall biosynthesis
MRVTVVEPDAVGGLAHFAFQLCEAMTTLGIEVTLVTSTRFELSELPRRFSLDMSMRLWSPVEPDRGRPRCFPGRALQRGRRHARRGFRAAVLVREWTRLVARLLRERPDVVQFGKIPFPFEALFLAYLRRKGLTLTQVCHEFEQREQASGWRRRLQTCLSRSIFDQFRLIAFLCETTRREFEQTYPTVAAGKLVIPHGSQDIFRALRSPPADPPRYDFPPGAKIILFFGGVRPSKGVADLIDGFALLPRDPSTYLLVAGYPSREVRIGALRAKAATLTQADRIILDLRYIDPGEVAGLLELATVIVLPYRSATQSGVLHLAYSFGCPVVATRVGGLAEDIEEGRSGLLVPPGDPPALAAALARILGDPALREELGARGRELSRTRHAWTSIAATLLASYGEIAADADGTAG